MGLTYSSVAGADPDEVFARHSRPGAITRLTLGRTQTTTGPDVSRRPGAAGRGCSTIPDITNPGSPRNRIQT
jgi:hypothetical protein